MLFKLLSSLEIRANTEGALGHFVLQPWGMGQFVPALFVAGIIRFRGAFSHAPSPGVNNPRRADLIVPQRTHPFGECLRTVPETVSVYHVHGLDGRRTPRILGVDRTATNRLDDSFLGPRACAHQAGFHQS